MDAILRTGYEDAIKMPTVTVVGAQVTSPPPSSPLEKRADISQTLTPTSSVLSVPSVVGGTTAPDFDPHVGAKPCSPFYRHGTLPGSAEKFTVETKITEDEYIMQDLEQGVSASQGQLLTATVTCQSKLWAKTKRSRSCLRSLSRRQRLAVKILIAIVTLGTMVGIALGITAAVGGGVWRSKNQQSGHI